MKMFSVPASHVDQAWRDGAYNLAEACKRCDDVTGDQLKLMLARGEFDLIGWADDTPQAWAAVTIQQLPNLRSLYIYAIWGRGKASREALNQLVEYARHNGCTRIRGACDETISRLWRRYGFTPAYTVMELKV